MFGKLRIKFLCISISVIESFSDYYHVLCVNGFCPYKVLRMQVRLQFGD